ncbi:uncharacterized protein [Henckelia pumila]|uniref:uncharacterized protein n=1 Tax=Henckelia pumila TaxID=405737 RepID=UPI003C6E4413
MHRDKSPGPDGLNPGFYQSFWDVTGPKVTSACLAFLNQGFMPAKINETSLILITKKKKPDTLSDVRPISLCNVLYKIVSKMVANRLKVVLNSVISHSHSAFTPGRGITDNVLIAFEISHYMKRKRQGKSGNAALKIDMSKAYDRVEWAFLQNMMLKLGDFQSKWVDFVMLCISSVSYMVVHNGQDFGPIVPQRGLRQGDPLSPYLFLICAEGLSSLLQAETRRGAIHGVKVARRALPISHLFFADDSFLFFKATEEEAANIKSCLDQYEFASGQKVNFLKSSISFSENVPNERKNLICETLGVRYTTNHGAYLGLPSLIGRKKSEVFAFVKEKTWSRMQERMMNSFWWGGADNNRGGLRWLRWDKLTLHKADGGLGFRNIHHYNLALLAKQSWKLVANPHSLASQVLKAMYYPNSTFMDAKMGSNPSYVWRSIMATQDLIRRGARIRIGSGNLTHIWNTPWLPDLENPFVVTDCPIDLKLANVNSLREAGYGSWDLDLLDDLFIERDKHLISAIPLSRRECEDKWIWGPDRNGSYSVKSGYKILQLSSGLTPQASANQKRIFNSPPRTQQSDSKWIKPPRQFLKCNVDAAIFNSPPRMRFGCIIRDSVGEAVAAVHGCFPGVFDPRTAEALSIREALSWLKDLSYSNIMVESDALTLIEALKKRSPDDSYVGLIIEDCRFLALELNSCSFIFVRRSANQTAHTLAKAAGSLSGRKGRVIPSPSLVSVVVVQDL